MRNKRFIRRVLVWTFIMMMTVSFLCTFVTEAEVSYGSITLSCSVEKEKDIVYLSGDEFSLIKIADAEDLEGQIIFRTLPEYSAYDCSWTTLNASQARRKAETMAKDKAVTDRAVQKGTTNVTGEVSFSQLPAGLYLAVRSVIAEKNKSYKEEPLLIFLPQQVNGIISYNVYAEIKIQWKEDPGPKPPPESKPKPVPAPVKPPAKTGDENPTALYILLAVLTGAYLLLWIISVARHTSNNKSRK